MRYLMSAQGVSEIRVVPALDDNRQPEPMMLSGAQEDGSLSHAFCKVDLVTYFGPKRYSMVAPGPYSEQLGSESISEPKGPIHHFVDFIRNYVDSNPRTCPSKWRRWLGLKDEGDTTRPKEVLSRPSRFLLLQGYLLQHRGEVIKDQDGNPSLRGPVVLCVRGSGCDDFFDKVIESLDPNAPWGPLNNKLGDVVCPSNGVTLQIIPYSVVHNNQSQSRYKCEGGQPFPLGLPEIEAAWKPWEDLLDYRPSLAELGVRLAMAFDAETVIKVFEGCPVYRKMLTSTVHEMAEAEQRASAGRVQTGWGGQPPAPPQQPAYTPPPQHNPVPTAPRQSVPPAAPQAAGEPQQAPATPAPTPTIGGAPEAPEEAPDRRAEPLSGLEASQARIQALREQLKRQNK